MLHSLPIIVYVECRLPFMIIQTILRHISPVSSPDKDHVRVKILGTG